MELQFFRCAHCKKIVAIVNPAAVPTICCGQPMEQLIPGTTDGASEKHIPEVTRSGNEVKVKVGSIEHPMTAEHYIQWICLQTKNGNQRKILAHTDKPEASFLIYEDDEIEAVYEYCNLHGLWKK